MDYFINFDLNDLRITVLVALLSDKNLISTWNLQSVEQDRITLPRSMFSAHGDVIRQFRDFESRKTHNSK